MFKKTSNTYLFFILAIILASLIAAFIIEHILGHKPCKLCIYERTPYILSVFLILEIIFFKKHVKITLLLLSLLFFFSAILAFYHHGIEQGFFKESLVCLNENFSEFNYWRGKSYLLIAKIFIKSNEIFQAKSTLESLIDKTSYEEIKNEALDILNEKINKK